MLTSQLYPCSYAIINENAEIMLLAVTRFVNVRLSSVLSNSSRDFLPLSPFPRDLYSALEEFFDLWTDRHIGSGVKYSDRLLRAMSTQQWKITIKKIKKVPK